MENREEKISKLVEGGKDCQDPNNRGYKKKSRPEEKVDNKDNFSKLRDTSV